MDHCVYSSPAVSTHACIMQAYHTELLVPICGLLFEHESIKLSARLYVCYFVYVYVHRLVSRKYTSLRIIYKRTNLHLSIQYIYIHTLLLNDKNGNLKSSGDCTGGQMESSRPRFMNSPAPQFPIFARGLRRRTEIQSIILFTKANTRENHGAAVGDDRVNQLL